MKNYLDNLNERERGMAFIGLLCLALYSYYLVFYTPLNNLVLQKKVQFIEKTETLAWMEQIQEHKHSIKKKERISNSQLLTLLANELKNNKTVKASYQLQQTGSGEIQLSFDAVPFNLFLNWIATINQQYTFAVKQLSVQKSNTPGITKLMIILSA